MCCGREQFRTGGAKSRAFHSEFAQSADVSRSISVILLAFNNDYPALFNECLPPPTFLWKSIRVQRDVIPCS